MKHLLLGLLWRAAQLTLIPYVRGGFFDRVQNLVLFAMDSEHSGVDKRRKVQEWLSEEYGEVAEIVQNLAIELAVTRLVLPNKRS